MNECSIIMYHYTRDLADSRYPEMKAKNWPVFLVQLDYLQENYAIISVEDLQACLQENKSLPKNACLLTFDDGYLEHYTMVFPELIKRGISACFYPSIAALERNKVLDVNKIHLLLAHGGYNSIDRLLGSLRKKYENIADIKDSLPEWKDLWTLYAQPGRFDSAKVIFFKRVLQHALPPKIRSRLLDELFREHMDASESTLAKELYVSKDMLRVMARNGMHIGIHGASHLWLDKIDSAAQKNELCASLAALKEIYDNREFILSIAYPFGGYNSSLLNLCESMDILFGLTTEARRAEINKSERLLLPRLDTNDILWN